MQYTLYTIRKIILLIKFGLKSTQILDSISIVTKQYDEVGRVGRVIDYEFKIISKKMVRIIQSYIDYIKRRVLNG
jgi:hypothetical protein